MQEKSKIVMIKDLDPKERRRRARELIAHSKKFNFSRGMINQLVGVLEVLMDNEEKAQSTPEIFVLMTDDWGSTFSKEYPVGVAVTTEEEADRYVKDGNFGFSQSAIKVTIFENKDDALEHISPGYKSRKEEKDGG